MKFLGEIIWRILGPKTLQYYNGIKMDICYKKKVKFPHRGKTHGLTVGFGLVRGESVGVGKGIGGSGARLKTFVFGGCICVGWGC